ncbi:hypothetical protein CFP56_011791 [Quercus suber]|uniref:Uncharacterized protein n=1 Tax=Quercus suber TaxID=58331 RepID=A0AAW0KWY2_QUESU
MVGANGYVDWILQIHRQVQQNPYKELGWFFAIEKLNISFEGASQPVDTNMVEEKLLIWILRSRVHVRIELDSRDKMEIKCIFLSRQILEMLALIKFLTQILTLAEVAENYSYTYSAHDQQEDVASQDETPKIHKDRDT